MSLKNVEATLKDYENLLEYTLTGNGVIIKSKQYIKDKAKWAKITELVRQDLGGKYVPKNQGGPYWFAPLESQANNGTYGSLHCPHCGKSIDITFKPKRETA